MRIEKVACLPRLVQKGLCPSRDHHIIAEVDVPNSQDPGRNTEIDCQNSQNSLHFPILPFGSPLSCSGQHICDLAPPHAPQRTLRLNVRGSTGAFLTLRGRRRRRTEIDLDFSLRSLALFDIEFGHQR